MEIFNFCVVTSVRLTLLILPLMPSLQKPLPSWNAIFCSSTYLHSLFYFIFESSRELSFSAGMTGGRACSAQLLTWFLSTMRGS